MVGVQRHEIDLHLISATTKIKVFGSGRFEIHESDEQSIHPTDRRSLFRKASETLCITLNTTQPKVIQLNHRIAVTIRTTNAFWLY